MNPQQVVQSQYLSALAMLKQAIVKCPPAMWDAPQDKDKFWFKAYYALYYAHLYLQPTREDFVRWKKHSHPKSSAPLTKEEILAYLAFVQQEVARRVPTTVLDGDPGFQNFHINKLELQLVNIR